MDAVFLARVQFAMTAGFHFLFPPVSIGLAWLVVIMEGLGWKKKSEIYQKAGKFFGKLLALTFAVGVATGIVMEFQFGTNWAEYSKFVGDIFGAPLAAEGVFAFFLESGFLGLYLFGRNRVSKGVHWFSALMVAFGATLSAFWIIAANSWQQTPAGYRINNNRAELTSFFDAVFNESTLPRYFHTVDAALMCGAFFVAGIAAYYLLRKQHLEVAKSAMKVAVIFGLIVSVMEVFPFGHVHAQQVARTQPEKFAAIEGLYTTQTGAPVVLFAIPSAPPPALHAKIEVPKLLSYMAFGDVNAKVRGINEFPKDEIPPLVMTFVSFHTMVGLGMFMILVLAWAFISMRKNTLWENKKLLKILLWSIPVPVLACQVGWMAAEIGRQPWIVYKLLRTSFAASITVSAGEILFSIIMFGIIYLSLLGLYIFLLAKEVKHGPEELKKGAPVKLELEEA
ncbi:MAG: cytochrome ubiquinol oxidase subunit I [Ignavibacteria bacterium]|jgi:cytochrome d ubiquinol oxidase subunit I|nr:cytochrome ubiquinol oxidase subunit I [Ignavibacteria bacterium]MCU7499520.1 cytochrome ubiquinol oxidase subunit I [Ignavibacteria bacterium]MCU7519532.1 cytochrome ubiquinol oxidase subunit I [Ignavibacteria bacterium]MCU7524496.1 cytochrome ubiquinol oxidase subunit I [Ignavibacteria bacterium]